MARWVLYGATGYTGVLLSEEAARRGHRPILAGRNPQKLQPLAERLGLEWKAVAISDAEGLRSLLDGAGAVLHAAGPFVDTSRAMADACLAAGCSYLDITGELPVFEALFARDAEAKAKQVALIPGVGFDVVPSDCLAAWVAGRLPGAQRLEIALAMLGEPSAGTAKSAVGLLGLGGRERRDGVLVATVFGQGVHEVTFSGRKSWAVPAPIADVVTAWHSTRIPNIRVSFAISSGVARALRLGWPMVGFGRPLVAAALESKMIRSRIDAVLEKRSHGPDAERRAIRPAFLYAQATHPDGRTAEGWLETSNGYAFTQHAAISAVEQVLAKKPSGALAPSQAFGADFVLSVPGTKRFEQLSVR